MRSLSFKKHVFIPLGLISLGLSFAFIGANEKIIYEWTLLPSNRIAFALIIISLILLAEEALNKNISSAAITMLIMSIVGFVAMTQGN